MTKNVGGADKIIRIIVGVALLALFAMDQSKWWGLIGIVPLATALLGWCPLYTVLGVKTCPADSKPQE